jgi:hypothetical protein
MKHFLHEFNAMVEQKGRHVVYRIPCYMTFDPTTHLIIKKATYNPKLQQIEIHCEEKVAVVGVKKSENKNEAEYI